MKQEFLEDVLSQKNLLQEMNKDLRKRLMDLEKTTARLEHNIAEKIKAIDNLHEDKKILTGLLKKPHKNKILRNTTIVIALGLAIFIFISYAPNDLQSIYNSGDTPLKTQYLLQNLKSNTVDTWKPWHLISNQILNVNIINADKIPKQKIDAIMNAILSEESVKIDNSLVDRGPAGTVSTYYKGWQGAIDSLQNEKTKFHIPTKFNIIESPTEEGDVTIILSTLENPDGYHGYTKTITDGNEILKSSITIYDVNNLSSERLGAIVRHEFGHALGLGHSTKPEDLMYYVTETQFPMISDCDISAIKDLYSGKYLNDISCEPQKSM
jgi:hypothetical protein